MLQSTAGSGIGPPLPALIGVDQFQPGIPQRDALQQWPPPLHRPCSECDKVVLPIEIFAANGEKSLNCLSQPRGQPQFNRGGSAPKCFFISRPFHANCSETAYACDEAVGR